MGEVAPSSKLNFQALLLANEQRNAYGLRYNDYERYRKHCANRTHRLRSSLKMTHGKGREFKKLPPVKTENIKDGYLQLLLFEAERAWAYSSEFSKQAALPANREKASVLRRNATSRFRKAVNWATQLLSHCQTLHAASRLSAENLVEATIYTLILNGRFNRHRYTYEDGLIQLSVARSLLDNLATSATTSRDQALATSFADEIGPEIRHSAHEMRRSNAYDVDAIVREFAAEHKNELVEGYDGLVKQLEQESSGGAEAGRKKLKIMLWEGEPVPVRNPELVDVLLRVQEAEEKLTETSGDKQPEAQDESGKKKSRVGKGTRSKRGVAAYDAILLALSDAEEVARKLVEAQQLSTGGAANAAGTRDMQFVHAYIVYQLLARRIQRDLLLISTIIHQSQSTTHHPSHAQKGKLNTAGPSKPRKEQIDARIFPAVVKLLDTVLQSLGQIRTLTIVDDSADLASATDARISYTKASRCRYLARCYTPLKKYAEALALMQQAANHIREARAVLSLLPSPDADPISTGEPAFYPLDPTSLSALDDELAADSLQCKKDWFAFNGGSTSTSPTDAKSKKKPLFFDIALNYVQLDMDRLQERAGKKSQPAPVAIAAPKPQQQQQQQRAPLAERAEPEKKGVTSRAAVEESSRASTPEPSAAPPRGGLSSLLGGWWGRK